VSKDILLQVKKLKTYFYERGAVIRAVDDISYSIQRQEILGIVGESGCGKTINSWSIMRLIPANGRIVEGEILLHRKKDGSEEVINLVALKADEKRMCDIRGGDIGMIFQEPMTSLSPVHTIGNQILETIKLHGDIAIEQARERVRHLLVQVGIPRPQEIINEYPYQLSGGMRQRVMIAIALACKPSLLIADEPTTALDVTIQAQILTLMQKLQNEIGMAIMFITHNLSIIAEMANRVIVMYLGKIVETGPTEEVYYNPCHPYTQALLKSIPGLKGRPKSKLDSIRGSIPSPFVDIRGCSFFDRCPQRIPGICDINGPKPAKVATDHDVFCFLYA
jgi:peptide/nickel transport system ATP-binding protein